MDQREYTSNTVRCELSSWVWSPGFSLRSAAQPKGCTPNPRIMDRIWVWSPGFSLRSAAQPEGCTLYPDTKNHFGIGSALPGKLPVGKRGAERPDHDVQQVRPARSQGAAQRRFQFLEKLHR